MDSQSEQSSVHGDDVRLPGFGFDFSQNNELPGDTTTAPPAFTLPGMYNTVHEQAASTQTYTMTFGGQIVHLTPSGYFYVR